MIFRTPKRRRLVVLKIILKKKKKNTTFVSEQTNMYPQKVSYKTESHSERSQFSLKGQGWEGRVVKALDLE